MTTDPHERFTAAELADLDNRAVQLVAIAHGDGDVGDVHRITVGLDHTRLIGLAISCAAMVDPDKSPSRLLAWMAPDDPAEGWTDDELRRAHAQHARGIVDADVQRGERIYQRTRRRRSTSRTAVTQ